MTLAAVPRIAIVAVVSALALASAGCEKPDASHVTSPSARLLIGTTTGNVSYAPEGAPPAPVPPPEGWDFELGNVRFQSLEDGTPALQIVTQVDSQPGAALEMWITGADGPLLRWSAGSTREYTGTVCFMLRLEEDGEALDLHGEPYDFTMAFRDPADQEIVTAATSRIAGFQPEYEGAPPGPNSPVARELLGCPRAPI